MSKMAALAHGVNTKVKTMCDIVLQGDEFMQTHLLIKYLFGICSAIFALTPRIADVFIKVTLDTSSLGLNLHARGIVSCMHNSRIASHTA